MDWWYINNKRSVTSEYTNKLQDELMSVLRQGNKPSAATLYEDDKSFHIKTTNKTFLEPFLFEHGFKETGEGRPKTDLSLLFGKD